MRVFFNENISDLKLLLIFNYCSCAVYDSHKMINSKVHKTLK